MPKDGSYLINLDYHAKVRANYVACHLDKDRPIYLDSFGVNLNETMKFLDKVNSLLSQQIYLKYKQVV